MDDKGKALREGGVYVNGKEVAKIESSSVGPIIRYTDGTFESL